MERVPTGAYLDFAVSSLSNRVSLIRHQLAMLTKRFYILQLALACFTSKLSFTALGKESHACASPKCRPPKVAGFFLAQA